jgi:hypothetical protein
MTATTRPHDHTHNDHTHKHVHMLGKRAGYKRAEADKRILTDYRSAEIWLKAWESLRLREVWRMPNPYEGVGTEVRLLLNVLSAQVRDTYERAYMRTYIERMTEYAMWESNL